MGGGRNAARINSGMEYPGLALRAGARGRRFATGVCPGEGVWRTKVVNEFVMDINGSA